MFVMGPKGATEITYNEKGFGSGMFVMGPKGCF